MEATAMDALVVGSPEWVDLFAPSMEEGEPASDDPYGGASAPGAVAECLQVTFRLVSGS